MSCDEILSRRRDTSATSCRTTKMHCYYFAQQNHCHNCCRRFGPAILLFLLLFFGGTAPTTAEIFPRPPAAASAIFDFLQFTSPQYNLSIFENAEVGTVAVADGCAAVTAPPLARLRAVDSAVAGRGVGELTRRFGGCAFAAERVGVQLPKGYHQVSFKIVDGDKSQRFAASTRRIGNFAFLIVEFRHEDILNRELESDYRLVVRAVAKRRRAGALETSTIVNLRVRDENDNAPMFRQIEYTVDVDDRTPINTRLVRLDGFDADEGLNGELLYSAVGLPQAGAPLYIESDSGWVRSYGALKPGNYSIEYRIEDRASRLAQSAAGSSGDLPAVAVVGFIRNRATVRITVTERRKSDTPKPRVHLETVPFEPYRRDEQLVGRLRVEDAIVDAGSLEIRAANASQPPNYWRFERRAADSYDVFASNVSATVSLVEITVAERLIDDNAPLRDIHTVILKLTPDSDRSVLFDWKALRAVALAAGETMNGIITTVEDTGDEPTVHVSVSEATPVGETIEQFPAFTTYAEEQQRIRYKLQPLPDDESTETVSKSMSKGFPVSPFDLSQRRGQLRLKLALDFDDASQRRRFIYRLSAHLDGMPAAASATAKLIVTLVDANDNCPRFVDDAAPADFVVRLDSKVEQDTIILNAKATDSDAGRNRQIVYKLLNVVDGGSPTTNSTERFRINALTGEVRINGILPPNENAWPLRVLAMDLGAPLPHFTQFTVNVQRVNFTVPALALGIVDSCGLPNEVAPAFRTRPHETPLAVDEDAPIGMRIGEVLAVDADAGCAGWVRYALDDAYFGVNPENGSLFVRADLTPLVQKAKKEAVGQLLDVEHVDHFLDIVARDNGTPTIKSSRATFRVRIRAVNRHAPEFEKVYYTATIEENRVDAEIVRVRAFDRDIGAGGRVARYALVAVDGAPDDAFATDAATGALSVKRALQAGRVHLTLAAADSGQPPRLSFVNVTVDVTEVNGKMPRCIRKVHTARLAEDAPEGQLVLCLAVAATRPNFILVPHDGEFSLPFRVDSASGCIFVSAQVDYETAHLHEFNVTVRDGMSEGPSVDCAVRVELVDVEEDQRPPRFAEVAYEVTVDDNALVHTEILHVTAIDPEGSPVAYRLIGGNGLGFFEIDAHTGVIRTAADAPPLSDKAGFWLAVCAADASGRTAVAHVHVCTARHRRRAPIFGQPIYFARVVENSDENKIVTKVEATSESNESSSGNKVGSNGGVKYSIIKGNPQSHFVIDENSGYIVTGRRRLDYETQPEHELEVRACSEAEPPACASALIVVNVEDANDCAPVFDAPALRIEVPADQPAGTFLTRVFATDADAPASANAALSYRIHGDADAERFRVDEHGRLSAVEPLKASATHTIRLVARDSGKPPLEGNTTLTIVVVGRANKFTVSNRRPRLLAERMWRELFVSDSDAVGTAVGKVSAVDDDGDTLWWSLPDNRGAGWSNPNASFAFRNGADGELVLARRVSAIDPSLNEIKLRFRVSDGIDFVEDTITVRISRSSNGARPEFAEPRVAVTLSVDAPVGTVVHTARAQLPTTVAGPQPRIVYALYATDDAGAADLFRVEQRSGNFLLASAPTRLRANTSPITVIISATTGGGSGGRANFQRVDVQLEPANEHAPAFVHDSYAFVVPSSAKGDGEEDAYVGFVEAFDADVGDFGRITYEIVSGNENDDYRINATTGELYRRTQKRSGNPDSLTMRASDAAVPTRSSTCAVRVYDETWLDEHNTEQLNAKLDSRKINVDDDEPAGSNLLLLDSPGAKTPVSYALDGAAPAACAARLHVHFASGRVHAASGAWRVDEPLNANCTFVASANGIVETVAASLNVTPNQWRVPRFERSDYTAFVDENAPTGRTLEHETGRTLRIGASTLDGSLLQHRLIDFAGDAPRFVAESAETTNATSATVVLRTIGEPFDFETTRSWTLAIVAQIDALSAQAARRRASFALVRAAVRDANDEPPQFTRAAYLFKLRWPPVYGTVIGTLDASDLDTVGKLRYALRGVEARRAVNAPATRALSDARRLFRIDRRSGTITVGVDDETLFSADVESYKLDAIVSDGIHTGNTLATIHVVRESKSALRFPQSAYTITVVENQTITSAEASPLLSLWPVGARLGDSFDFRLASPHAAFTLDKASGLLRLNRSMPLDRETTPRLRLAVVAMPRSNASDYDYDNAAYAVITVDVEDVNDCAPSFTQSLYTADVADGLSAEEGAVRVLAVRATDADVGMAGVVRYWLADDAPTFLELNKYDGRITVTKNGTESIGGLQLGAEYRFHVLAADQGTRALESRVEVRLRVVSQYQPICVHARYSARVADAAAPGAHVITVRATLAAVDNVNGMVGYALSDKENKDAYRHFNIDFMKGIISLRRPLNAQIQSYYNLTVEAFDVTRVITDNSETTPRAFCHVEITVEPSKVAAPHFERLDYAFTVSEDSPIGTVIGAVRATRSDRADSLPLIDNDELTTEMNLSADDIVYSIIEGNRSTLSIDPLTGQLTLASRVDYEHRVHYEFLIGARRPAGPQSQSILRLSVVDVNDCAPEWRGARPLRLTMTIFDNDEDLFLYRFAEPELFDADGGAPSDLRFALASGDETLFRVDERNGVLTTRRVAFDEAAVGDKALNISVSDGRHTVYIDVIVKVQLSREMGPRFQPDPYTVVVGESREATNKSALLTLRAAGGSPPLAFSLAGTPSNDQSLPLVVDPTDGRVFLRRRLNREKDGARITIPVTVSDMEDRRAFSTIHVNIADENDNAPVWIAPADGYSTCIDVSTAARQTNEAPFATVLATDEDVDDRLEYTLLNSGGPLDRLFDVHSTSGAVSWRRDANSSAGVLGGEARLRLRVSDAGNPPHQSDIRLRVKFAAAGAFVPRFVQPRLFFAVGENTPAGATVGDVSAIVTGPSDSQSLRYELLSGSNTVNNLPFVLDAASGDITVAAGAQLDYETCHRYDFVVSANVAKSDCRAYIIVTVAIVDANDNAPVFRTVYDNGINVREDTPPGSTVALFLAEDADRRTSASRIIYSLENDGSTDAFAIDMADGRLTVGSAGLDRERRAAYRLRVFAADEAHRQSEAQVVDVRVIDVNDVPPRFGRSAGYEAEIKADQSLEEGRAILHFNITDSDMSSSNAELRVFVVECSTSPEQNHNIFEAIAVSQDQSALVLTRAAAQTMHAGVWRICLLAGDGRHYSNTTITLRLAPRTGDKTSANCNKTIAITVAGNATVGSTVYSFPTGKNVRLLSDGTSNAFELRNESILITDADFYRRPNYTVHAQIRSTEGSSSQSSCLHTVHITILSANREAPKFAQQVYTATVAENLNVSREHAHFLLRVEAHDDDVGAFGCVRYTLVSPEDVSNSSAASNFALDTQTGALTLHRALDRETDAHVRLRVSAEDGGGLRDYAIITVNVEDVNDNAPTFPQDEYRVQVLESEPVGCQLLVLRAEDRDLHAHISYALDAAADVAADAQFVVDAESGALRLAAQLDAERRRQWTLRVVASDSAARPLTAVVRVIVDVLDVNDNAPRFDRQLYEATLSEATAVGTRVLQVSAIDADSEHFGRVSYSLSFVPAAQSEGSLPSSDASAVDYFEIDPTSGWLALRRLLDYEKIQQIRLNVHAIDGGQPPLSDDAVVHITVTDFNDNAPIFADCNQTAVVQEGVAPGHALLSVTLSDADGSSHGAPFQLTLSGEGATLFAFDPLHNLITTQPIAYPKHQQFTLTATATDTGGLSSSCPIRIFVKPQSKYPPDVRSLSVTLNTLYGEFLGGAIGRVFASDKDPSDMLRYSIVDSTPFIPYSIGVDGQLPVNALNTMPRFSIDPETGVLSAPADLLPGFYRFNASVTDGKFVVAAPVSVDVADVDQTALDHALNARLRGVSARQLVGERLAAFHERIARAVGAAPSAVRVLSIEDVHDNEANTDATFARYRRGLRYTEENDIRTTDHNHRLIGYNNHNEVSQNENAFARYLNMEHLDSGFNILNTSSSSSDNDDEWIPFESQTQTNHYRSERDASSAESFENVELDVLFTVQRGELLSSSSRGYYRPTYIKQRVESASSDFDAATPLEIVRLSAEVCRRDICVKGECRDRLWLDNRRMRVYAANDGAAAFVAPAHRRAFECLCRPGFGGRYCDVPINQCSKELCLRTEMCIPSEEHAAGFVCSCPPGLRGERCAQPTCAGAPAGACAQREAIGLLGAGFFQLALSSSVEARLELGLSFRTLSRDATLLYGAGDADFHELRLKEGILEYRWSCGSGVGFALFGAARRVDDGAWHELTVSRRGRQTRMVLDGVHVAEGASPPGSDVVNLYRQATVLTFGARVTGAYESPLVREAINDSHAVNGIQVTTEPHFRRHRRHHRRHGRSSDGPTRRRHAGAGWRETAADLRQRVDSGMVGCFGKIAIDGYDVPKTEQGLRLYNAAVGCDESHMGPCLSVPCKNNGHCMPNRTHNTYSCSCPLRFTGAHCEIDLNACAASPCPNGIACHNLYNDFHCSCPPGFTGKTCQLSGGWDPCVTAPCGPHGTCQRRPTSADNSAGTGAAFICYCEKGYAGQFCNEQIPTTRWSGAIALNSLEFYGLLAAFATTVFLAALAICVCQRRAASKDDRRTTRKSRCSKREAHSAPRSLGSVSGATGGSSLLSGNRASANADDGSTPLVPRRTAAPCHAAADDRPPPPLPPKLRAGSQLYQNLHGNGVGTASASGSSLVLNGFGHAQYHVNGLPAVEVRPMRAGSASCASPSFNKPDKSDSAPRPPPHGTQRNSQQPTPPLHKHAQQQQENRLAQQQLNHHSQQNDQQKCELTQQQSHCHHKHNQHVCTPRASQRFSQNGAAPSVARQLYDRVTAEAAAGGGVGSASMQTNGDYLTMKPVHRAKPFFNANAPALSQLSDDGEETGDETTNRNGDYVEAQRAPSPPAHGKLPSSSSHNGTSLAEPD